MRPQTPLHHSWDLTPKEAAALQVRLGSRVRRKADFTLAQIKTIAGADCAFDLSGRFGYGGLVVFTYPDLTCVERAGRRLKLSFPYVPGLLSFRETPLLLAAAEKLKKLPDLLIIDGQGLAHPRRFGIACHMGLLLDRPTIGCAKSRLVGEHEPVPARPGSHVPLTDGQEIIGRVVRTKRNCKPVFVSIGHRIDLELATLVLLSCVDRYRMPEPSRQADRFVAQLKSEI
jgi:deoxyribonuclease V